MVITRPQKRKATFGVRTAGCVTFFRLVGGEATGWCSRNLELSLKLPSSTWVGPQSCRTQRHCYAYFLSRNKGPVPRLYHHLIPPPLFPYRLHSLISNCLNLSFGTQGRSRRLNEGYILKQEIGNTERICTPEPHRVLLILIYGTGEL